MHYLDLLAIFGAKYLYLLMVLTVIVWFWQLPSVKQKEVAVYGLVMLSLTFIVARLASLVYFDPRPFVVGHFTPLVAHSADNGFPSDHTLLAGALMALVWPYARRLGLVLAVLAVLVGLARVYVGVHHLIDIAGSLIIASLVAYLVRAAILPYMLNSRWYKKIV